MIIFQHEFRLGWRVSVSVVMSKQLCLYVQSFSSKGVTWSSSKISSFLLWSRRVYPAVRRKYFISAVRSLFLSHCLTV
jgi:hypothetical protein